MIASPKTRKLIQYLRVAGDLLLEHFGKIETANQKGDQSNIVCEADLAAERCIVKSISEDFPEDSIIAEESGLSTGTSEFTWIIDPLDGTSNFVAGIPWFGVQIAILQNAIPIMAAIYIPTAEDLYWAERGKGVYRNDTRVFVSPETNMRNVLCSFAFDSLNHQKQMLENAQLLCRVARCVRNIRATNSLLDFCYTIDGRIGACINLNSKLWDIVPLSLMICEARGKLTDLQGSLLRFCIDASNYNRDYAVLGASRILHRKLVPLTTEWKYKLAE